MTSVAETSFRCRTGCLAREGASEARDQAKPQPALDDGGRLSNTTGVPSVLEDKSRVQPLRGDQNVGKSLLDTAEAKAYNFDRRPPFPPRL